MPGYVLAVDLGTTWTAAAVWRKDRVEIATLGGRSASIPSVVLVEADGTVLVGDAALRRALELPERVVREVKRRVGDDAPVLVGGTPWAAELLLARVLRHVVDAVSAEQGGPPDHVVLTHPANWGRYKLDLLTQAARQVGVEPVTLVPEPVAAAAWYAAEHRVRDGGVVAVYDLGGGTFDAAVVRRSGDHFELLGRPDGIERLGGIDIDAAVLGTVTGQLGDAWTTLDRSDPEALADVLELRDRCVEAKEALSVDTVASIPVRLPTARTTVRMTRAELEEQVRGPIGETVVALQRTIASADLTPADLDAVLLVGGASRMPVIAQEVSTALGVEVAVDANPKLAVAAGAALVAGREAPEEDAPAPPPAPPASVAEPREPPGPRRRWWVPVAAVGGAAALIAAAVLVLGGDDDGGGDDEAAVVAEDVDDGVLRVALLAPDTGEGAFLSAAYRAAGDLAVEDVNAAGGVADQPIELFVFDAGSTPEDGLIDDAVQQAMRHGGHRHRHAQRRRGSVRPPDRQRPAPRQGSGGADRQQRQRDGRRAPERSDDLRLRRRRRSGPERRRGRRGLRRRLRRGRPGRGRPGAARRRGRLRRDARVRTGGGGHLRRPGGRDRQPLVRRCRPGARRDRGGDRG